MSLPQPPRCGESTQQGCFGKSRDLVDEGTNAISQTNQLDTSGRLCVASDSDFAVETKSAGS